MNEKIEQLVTFIQENCLWQFFSRTWDREENIEGVLTKAAEILTGKDSKLDTTADRCFHADARILVSDVASTFPWIKETSAEEVKNILSGVKERIRFITITASKNEELNVENY
jgi:vanadium nitrogenase delta subunit